MFPRFNLLVFLFFFKIFSFSSASNLSLDFPFLSYWNLTLLGDSYLRDDAVSLNCELEVPSSSYGTVVYNNPVQFFYSKSNSTTSFSIRFFFSIININPTSFGDDLAFFISLDNQSLSSPDGYLGLVNSSQLTKNKFVEIEFDTKLDSYFNDPNENHVGLDIDSLNSIQTVDPILQEIDLKSGNSITSWIDYKNEQKMLDIFLSYSNFKPKNPVLTVNIDLSKYLMYVGFLGSTEGSTEIHLIENWSFQTSGFLPAITRLNPHNVLNSSVIVTPDLPVSNSTNKHHKRVAFGLGIAGPTFFCVVIMVFGYISLKKLKGMRSEKSVGEEKWYLATGLEMSIIDEEEDGCLVTELCNGFLMDSGLGTIYEYFKNIRDLFAKKKN